MKRRMQGKQKGLSAIVMVLLMSMVPLVTATTPVVITQPPVTGPAGSSVSIPTYPQPPAGTGGAGVQIPPSAPNPRNLPSNVGQPSRLPSSANRPLATSPGSVALGSLLWTIARYVSTTPPAPTLPPYQPSGGGAQAPAPYVPGATDPVTATPQEQWEVDMNLITRLQSLLDDLEDPRSTAFGKGQREPPSSSERACASLPENADSQSAGYFAPGKRCQEVQMLIPLEIFSSGVVTTLSSITPGPVCPQKRCKGAASTGGSVFRGYCLPRRVDYVISGAVDVHPTTSGGYISLSSLDQVFASAIAGSGGQLAKSKNWDYIIQTLQKGLGSSNKKIRMLAEEAVNRLFSTSGCAFTVKKIYDCFCYDNDLRLIAVPSLLRRLFGGITGGGGKGGRTLAGILGLGLLPFLPAPTPPPPQPSTVGCDANPATVKCEPGNCGAGKYCRLSDCSCQPNCGNSLPDPGEECDPPGQPCTNAQQVPGTCNNLCQCSTITLPGDEGGD